jgi:hypothetical protein
MMNSVELRDPDEARAYILEGLWWQRVVPPEAATVQPALEWAKEIAAGGQPLPPIGFVADLGHTAFSLDAESQGRDAPPVPGLPINLLRGYEDHVLGKLYADWTFGRAGDALRRYRGRDRARGLAFLLNQFRERARFRGVYLSPGVLTAALAAPPEELLARGWDLLERDGVQPLLVQLYEALVAACRRTAEVLGPEDLPELENGTALEDEGPRLARRQVRQAALRLEAALPRHRLRPRSRRREVPTRMLDEDTYPVGGFNAISTRGTVESLLHSQLAYMEPDDRPDLFDIKFLRDELLYYSRDENQFLRRRRTFVFALYPDLVSTRFKDRELPYQRGVLLLALILVAIRKLAEWLTTDALIFEIVFVRESKKDVPLADGSGFQEERLTKSPPRQRGANAASSDDSPLGPERALLGTLFPDLLQNKSLRLRDDWTGERLPAECAERGRRSLCHCLAIGQSPPAWTAERVLVSRLRIDGPRPMLLDDTPSGDEVADPVDCWAAALEAVLGSWL